MLGLRTKLLLPALLLAACSSSPVRVRGEDVDWRPAAPRARIVASDRATSPNVLSRFEPGTIIDLQEEPRAASGIPIPGGGFLPSLNGVIRSSRIDRPQALGLLPRVVAVVVDESGFEWYQHADGSMTSSRYAWKPAVGRWEAVTMHAIPE